MCSAAMRHNRKPAAIMQVVANALLRLDSFVAVHLALDGYDREVDARAEVILAFLALREHRRLQPSLPCARRSM
jgi:hypothetical protein